MRDTLQSRNVRTKIALSAATERKAISRASAACSKPLWAAWCQVVGLETSTTEKRLEKDYRNRSQVRGPGGTLWRRRYIALKGQREGNLFAVDLGSRGGAYHIDSRSRQRRPWHECIAVLGRLRGR